MTSREEIALQLTLKVFDKMYCPKSGEYTNTEDFNAKLADYVANSYNIIYNNIETNHPKPVSAINPND